MKNILSKSKEEPKVVAYATPKIEQLPESVTLAMIEDKLREVIAYLNK